VTGHEPIGVEDILAATRKSQFIVKMNELIQILSSSVNKFLKLARQQTKQKRRLESQGKLKVAEKEEPYKKYLRKGHYNQMLVELGTLCMKCRDNGTSVIDASNFKRLTYWLMANLCYLNGSRKQAAQLFMNVDFSRWQRTRVADTAHYSEVILIRRLDQLHPRPDWQDERRNRGDGPGGFRTWPGLLSVFEESVWV
jgi:hypothetical protein